MNISKESYGRNVKPLTNEELQKYKELYTIELSHDGKDLIITSNKNFRRTMHPINRTYNLNAYKTVGRKFGLTSLGIKMWIEHFKDTDFTLFDIQNAINKCIKRAYEVSLEDVKEKL